MSSPDVVIGLDLGTTSVKAAAFDLHGKVLAQAHAPLQLDLGADHQATQDPEAVAATAETTLQRCMTHLAGQGRVAAVGLSAAMHSLLAIDAQDQVRLPALTWMDSRAQAAAQALRTSAEGPLLYAQTGTPLHAMSPLAKLCWLQSEDPPWRKQVRFVSLKEYLWHRWFGVWEIDASLASATGLYDLRQNRWHPQALEKAGISAEQLSTIVPTTWIRPSPAEGPLAQLGLPAGTPLCIGASDGVLANLGSGVLEPGTWQVTLGTSMAIRTATPSPTTRFEAGTFCYLLTPGRYVVGAPSNSGGIVLQWLADQLTDATASDRFETLFAALDHTPPGADGVLCLPYLSGERAPLWNEELSAGFYGIRGNHRREHLLRAGLEAIAYSARWIAAELDVTAPDLLAVSGGGFRDARFRTLFADIFGATLHAYPSVDASVLGAAALTCYAIGIWNALEQVHGWLPEAVVTSPDPAAHRRYAVPYARFRALAQAAAKLQ
ncbi:MAG: gluconokinase [Firmicutes bacterium]|nr:gluconokinase [Bacillota bacterium]